MKFLILLFLSFTFNISAQVSIITNKNSSISSISKAELAELYSLTISKLESEVSLTVVDSKSLETRNIFGPV
jgi:hypothetical protein